MTSTQERSATIRHRARSGFRNTIPKAYRHALHRWLLSGSARVHAYAVVRPLIRAEMVRSGTQLVVEGYPRSASSYAVAVVWHSNGPSLEVAHHLHSPASVEMGVRRGLPVVVLLRRPVDAVASVLQMHAHEGYTPRTELRRYTSFYERVEPLASSVVIAPFEVVIEDFDTIITSVNEKFGTSFEEYRRTPEDEIAVRAMVDHMDGRQTPDGQPRETMVSRPSAVREATKAVFVEQITQCGPELEAAEGIHRRLGERP
ncbi:MAG: hypothetical protein ACLPVF_02075 [Acidimicrobiales bacterium]